MLSTITTYGRMIKFSHTIFALPFALSAVILALDRDYAFNPGDFFWIILAMIGARSAAMGFNRIVDAAIDAKNPRTAQREIPSGKITHVQSILFVTGFSALFLLAAAMLGKVCFYCAIPTLALLFSYSYTKRFTFLCHLFLGFAISMAPLGAWIATTKSFYWPILILSFALMTHISGFDILYACQDYAFDRAEDLYSIPSKYGIARALQISSILHVICFLSFIAIYFMFELHFIYLISAMMIGGILLVEHMIVTSENLTQIPIAFFHMNSAVSLILLAGIAGDVFLWPH